MATTKLEFNVSILGDAKQMMGKRHRMEVVY